MVKGSTGLIMDSSVHCDYVLLVTDTQSEETSEGNVRADHTVRMRVQPTLSYSHTHTLTLLCPTAG